MLTFTVMAALTVTVAESGPPEVFKTWPMTDRDRQLYAYRAANARFEAMRRLPGFEGYSLRPGCDAVIDGQHIALP